MDAQRVFAQLPCSKCTHFFEPKDTENATLMAKNRIKYCLIKTLHNNKTPLHNKTPKTLHKNVRHNDG